MNDLTVVDLAEMMGVRLVVLAARLECETLLQRDLHSTLIDALDYKICEIRELLALARDDDEESPWHYDGAIQSYFYHTEIALLDYVDVDTDTNEYKVNDGKWRFGKPTREDVRPEELGPIADLMNMIRRQTPFYVTARYFY